MGGFIPAPIATKPEVSLKEEAAKGFLRSLRRPRRQLWDRSQPDVQQWYQQFLYLGFDEAVSAGLPQAAGLSGSTGGCSEVGGSASSPRYQ